MLIELSLHVLPALRPSIEVNAKPMWKRFVDCSGGSVCYGFGHIFQSHEASQGLFAWKVVGGNIAGSQNCITLAATPQRLREASLIFPLTID